MPRYNSYFGTLAVMLDRRVESLLTRERVWVRKVQRLERAARASGRRSVAASMDQTRGGAFVYDG